MNITLWNAKVNTKDMTEEQARNNFDGDASPEEITRFKKAMQSVDGLEVVVTESFTGYGDGYVLLSWKQEDDDKWREFIWEMEQDPFFGAYCDDREGFLEVWNAGEYEPPGSMTFESDYLTIMSELKRK
ncbi:hypothetical protein Pryu01_03034 [Paraliobacillus ryukyuensis]|uniref:Uncharacterized protein n=1 Tax=Paraliobacillus ryukyuensis TaxID=200904 RepID=A0A366DQV8_9BACI|nr:hypothetical protein [Paraliobacillus ryukyuensis]RBO92265.1 hypothetical protein DES48_1153 [Paraliobacillus ryukyuensis]